MMRLLLAVVLAWPVVAWADFEAGMQAYKRGDYATALREWLPLAEAGDAVAQATLGVLYANGKGVPVNDTEAVKWYRRSAEQGNAFAQSNLGYRYEIGKGVARDDKQAVKWYRKAAEQGNAEAQTSLGSMYANGRGVPEDPLMTYAWSDLAADQGSAVAAANKAMARERMTHAQLTEARQISHTLRARLDSGQSTEDVRASAGPSPADDRALVRTVQQHLTALGHQPAKLDKLGARLRRRIIQHLLAPSVALFLAGAAPVWPAATRAAVRGVRGLVT